MLNYIDYLKIPTKIALVLVGILLILQLIGEFLEFKGVIVPEILKIRKYFARKKAEKKSLREMSETLKEVKALLCDVQSHYNSDNIALRDNWIRNVNTKLDENDKWFQNVDEKLSKNSEDILALLIDNKRNAIIDFASYVIDEKKPVTREQFNRIFKIHKEYEDIIKIHNLTNGEVDIAYRIITEAYEEHMRNHTFIEEIRGYDGD